MFTWSASEQNLNSLAKLVTRRQVEFYWSVHEEHKVHFSFHTILITYCEIIFILFRCDWHGNLRGFVCFSVLTIIYCKCHFSIWIGLNPSSCADIRSTLVCSLNPTRLTIEVQHIFLICHVSPSPATSISYWIHHMLYVFKWHSGQKKMLHPLHKMIFIFPFRNYCKVRVRWVRLLLTKKINKCWVILPSLGGGSQSYDTHSPFPQPLLLHNWHG